MGRLKQRLWGKILVCHLCMHVLLLLPSGLYAYDNDLTELSIEELANIEIISVTRTPLKKARSSAAIFVITADDIRRAGVTSIPEALRMVPGLDIARLSSSKWAVSSRGFNSRYSNKLLVLLDGRSVFLPLFSGVFWENQDLFIEDIERIEVVRGPANAMNGVINIITKHSKDTLGSEIVTGGGDYERVFARARYGESLGEKTFLRAYAGYFDRDEMEDRGQNGLDDSWSSYQTGFRSDSEFGDNCNLTVQGDVYRSLINNKSTIMTLNPPTFNEVLDFENETTGYNLLSRYTRRFHDGSEMAFQMYYDAIDKEEWTVNLKDHIIDFDFQFRMSPLSIHEIVWGLGYRLYSDEVSSHVFGISFANPERDDSLYSSFIQDTISVTERIQVIIGSRFEHNEYTGFEFQPNIRFLFEPNENHLLWVAVSRAVRTPSRGENNIRFIQQVIPPGEGINAESPFPLVMTIWGLESYKTEDLMAYEVGHRLKALDTFSLDTTAFYYRYDNLPTYELGQTSLILENDPPYVLQQLNIGNRMEAKTWGVELSANWHAASFLRFLASYTYYKADMAFNESPTVVASIYSNDDSPSHKASLRTSIDMPFNTECDIWVRYVDDILDGMIDSYTEMDIRLGWKASKNVELSLCGQNLLHKSHPEYKESYVLNEPAEVPRSVYGKVTLRF